MLTLHLSLKRNYWQNDRFKALGGNLPTNQVYFRPLKLMTPPHHHTNRKSLVFLPSLCCINDRCSMPVYTPITDLIEGQGGSALLIRMLNRIGVCASVATLAHFIQHKKFWKLTIVFPHPESFTTVSADNTEFLHSYSHVFKGSKNSSWHDKSVQGCDYILFFSQIGKAMLLRYFSQYATFIANWIWISRDGFTCRCGLENENYKHGYLAFIQLVGIRNTHLALKQSPAIHYSKFSKQGQYNNSVGSGLSTSDKQSGIEQTSRMNVIAPYETLFLHWYMCGNKLIENRWNDFAINDGAWLFCGWR